jgi:hypothetical protein
VKRVVWVVCFVAITLALLIWVIGRVRSPGASRAFADLSADLKAGMGSMLLLALLITRHLIDQLVSSNALLLLLTSGWAVIALAILLVSIGWKE